MQRAISWVWLSTFGLLFINAPTAYGQTTPPTGNELWTIGYHEVVDIAPFKVDKVKSGDSANRRANRKPTRMQIAALGRIFDIELTENRRLLSRMPKHQRDSLPASLAVLRGHLVGEPNSWVRISRRGRRMSGIIWDGSELFAIEPASKASGARSNRGSANRIRAKIFRLSDTFSTASCDTPGEHRQSNSAAGVIDELTQVFRATATKRLNISIVADTFFVADNRANPRAAVLERFNIVEGVFAEQVGVQINITDILLLSNNGSLSSSDARTLLYEFANATERNQFPNPGLSHLVTSRVIDGNIAGSAFIDTLCRRSTGVGFTRDFGNVTLGGLITAHELGHNFGAPHDNQSGSSCASTPGTFLMNPSLNGSDTFSQCSLQQIQPRVSSASCITNLSGNSPPPPPPPPQQATLISSGFNSSTGGFDYSDNLFTNNSNGGYASGRRLANGGFDQGALSVVLGGRNNSNISNISGGWQRTFTLNQPARLQFVARMSLTHAANFESDEYTTALVSIDSSSPTRLLRLTGNGNGGSAMQTGFERVSVNLGRFPAGTHTLNIGAFLNKKTWTDETSEVRIDDVSLTAN